MKCHVDCLAGEVGLKSIISQRESTRALYSVPDRSRCPLHCLRINQAKQANENPMETTRSPFRSRGHLISTDHNLATMAGLRILEQGGNVADAGVAADLCLNGVVPESANFGGVASLVGKLCSKMHPAIQATVAGTPLDSTAAAMPPCV